MKTIIAGSRNITDYSIVEDALTKISWRVTGVVSGTARGVDRLGEQWARNHGVTVRQFPADWDKYGKAAGSIRNEEMASNADALVAIWDGASRGTQNMVEQAKRHGLKVLVYYADGPHP